MTEPGVCNLGWSSDSCTIKASQNRIPGFACVRLEKVGCKLYQEESTEMGNRILVVDDEKEIADVIELYLKNEGFEVEKFYTGKDAIVSN